MKKLIGTAVLAGVFGLTGLREVWQMDDLVLAGATPREPRPTIFRATAYDANTRRLTLEFRNGYAYCYDGVPPTIYAAFLRANGPGAYYNQHIRGRYAMTRAPDRVLSSPVAQR